MNMQSISYPMQVKKPIPVPEVEAVDAETFAQEYVAKHQPVIVRQGIKHWQTMNWDDDYLKQVIGEQFVQVDIFAYLTGGKINLKEEEVVKERMTVSKFIACYQSTESNYYILNQRLFPALHQDLGNHNVFQTFPISRTKTLFWGHGGQKTPLHYDDNENIMCMCDGEKEFLLFDIADFKYMYPTKGFDASIDLDEVVTEEFPLFDRATPYVARISKGDILYVPCYWWHRVRSFGRNLAVSYIINETMAQRLKVVEKLVDCDTLPVSEEVKQDLLAIIRSEEKASGRNAKLKKYHREYVKHHGQSYYCHQIFHRLIEANIFDIISAHAG